MSPAAEAESRLDRAFAAIDAANAADPNTLAVDGGRRPKEQVHAELMTGWVRRLDPAASEEQLIAARAHHLRRWAIPRDSEPRDRSGYLRWRATLRRRHAEDVAEILGGLGYPDESIERVQTIVRKQGLGKDAAVQVHEDALCLVFLETQLDELAAKEGHDKMLSILRKTARKMSPAAREMAGGLAYSPAGAALLAEALDG
jgi:Domain of unknown function (DUF4202)